MDCLEAIRKYKLVGIYDIPIKYIEEAITKLLPAEQKLDEMTLMPNPKKSLENPEYLDEPTYMSKLSQ
jgi:hypothetical protein